jgi:hypothetical protein
VRKAGLADLPLDRLPVDVIQMNLPPGAWQEEGNHKGRWHVNYVLSAETPHDGKTTGTESLVMLAIHVSSARTVDDRAQGTQAWVRNP